VRQNPAAIKLINNPCLLAQLMGEYD
jgi:hypothetical protein